MACGTISRMRGTGFWGACRLLAATMALALAPAALADAAPTPVIVPGAAPIAGASSLRVPEFAGEGLRTNGRIFGFDRREGHYSCSGTALNTPSHSIVLTAGHCVLEGGSVGRRLVFVPAYDHGARPFGTFHVQAAYLMAQWSMGENADFDVAALRVAPNRLGVLTDVVGGRGYVTGRSRLADFQIFGY